MSAFRDDSSERTERPTPLRLTQARKDGFVPRSGDLVAAGVMLASVASLGVLGGGLVEAVKTMLQQLLTGFARPADTLSGDLWNTITPVLTQAGMLVGVLVVTAVVMNVIQFGALLSVGPITPDIGRIAPGRGLANIFSRRSVVRLAFTGSKLIVVTLIVLASISGVFTSIVGTVREPLVSGVGRLGSWGFALALRVSVGLLLLGILDLIYQRWAYIEDLKMTRRELQEDLKQMGTGRTAARRRTRQTRKGETTLQEPNAE